MADKIVVMQNGHIEQIGSPLELYDTPANTFVAGFIGSPSMNMLDGIVRKNGDGWAAEVDGTHLPIIAREGIEEGREVTVGIRPEKLSMSESGLEGKVSVVEPTGAETHVVVETGGGEMVAVFRDRHQLRPGLPLHFTAEPDAIHLFDKATTARIR